MAIDLGRLRAFVIRSGLVLKVYAPDKGELRILKDGSADILDIVDRATKFSFSGKDYSREEFEKLLDNQAPK